MKPSRCTEEQIIGILRGAGGRGEDGRGVPQAPRQQRHLLQGEGEVRRAKYGENSTIIASATRGSSDTRSISVWHYAPRAGPLHGRRGRSSAVLTGIGLLLQPIFVSAAGSPSRRALRGACRRDQERSLSSFERPRYAP